MTTTSPTTALAAFALAGSDRALHPLVEVEPIGGSFLTVLAVFVLLAVASVLSLLVAYRLLRGYLRSGRRPLLWLAVGLFLLTVAPTLVRVGMTSLAGPPEAYRVLAANGLALAGLLTILHTIYQR